MSRFVGLASVLVLANHMDGFLGRLLQIAVVTVSLQVGYLGCDCRAKPLAPLPAVTVGNAFGQRIHALAIYLKTRQAAIL